MNISGIRLGNGIARQYKNAKLRRRFFVIQSGLSTTAAVIAGKDGSLPGFGIFTGGTALFLAMAKRCHNAMHELQPAYKKIINRAKLIYKK